MPWPITFDDVLAARQRIRPYLPPTPLRTYPALDHAVGLHVLVKHENHQPTNSFKIRNALSALTAYNSDCPRGVIAASTGNHGQGLAWAGKQLGIPVTICVPLGNNPEKNAAIRGLGAQLVEEGRYYDDALATMRRIAKERSLLPIESTNCAPVIAGAATLTLELLEQSQAMGETLHAMVLAVGGGSQAVGAMTVLQHQQPGVRVFGVQSERASAIHDSCHAARPITKPADTFAEGIATCRPYAMTFDALRHGLAEFALVSDADIADAIRLLIRTTHNLVEGAAAAGLAGLRKLATRFAGKTVAIVLSGSNIDEKTLQNILARRV